VEINQTMKFLRSFLKGITITSSVCLSVSAMAQNPGLVISEFYINPPSTDSCLEYVELRATANINFSTTPYTVIVCNNGTATIKGWKEGGAITYAFQITSGSVSQGDVVYVGGSCMPITGTKIRTINVKNTNGDGGLGAFNTAGVFGNGGTNADGIAVFANKLVANIDSLTVPVDAVFYGTAMGTAVYNGGAGAGGYQLPVNDIYPGGKLQTTSFMTGDPGAGTMVASGTYNVANNLWTANRTWAASSTVTDGSSSVSIATTPLDQTPPTVLSLIKLNNSTLRAIFSEKTSVATATTVANYTINPSQTISSISLSATGDTAILNLASPLPIGVYSVTINNLNDTVPNTMTVSKTFTVENTGIKMQKYTWKTPEAIGAYKGMTIYNGGFSGMQYIKGSNNEFLVITDRGPNLDANNNVHALALGGANNTAKLFPMPGFSPNVIHVQLQGDSIVHMSSFDVKRPDGTSTTGLTNPSTTGGTGEIALADTNGTQTPTDVWGIDSEGLTAGNNNDFWIPEEYGVSVWHVDANGKAINRYAPYGGSPSAQPQDVAIDTIFKYRNPNKGFEGVAYMPNKLVYAFIQNSILFPASDAQLKKNTRLHRFVQINPQTNATRMYGYEHDLCPTSGATSTIKNDKRYIGDAVAVNDHQMLVLEHGKSATESYARVYLIDMTTATTIDSINHMVYAGGTKSFEQLLDSATAAANGVTCVKKTLFVDLIANGYDNNIEKEEGLTIINDTTIAIANDNDFGIISNNADGVMSANGVKSNIFVFTVPAAKKLQLCELVHADAAASAVCQGDSILLSSPAVSGISYQWTLNGTNVNNATNPTLYATQSGNYELRATNAYGCTAISNTQTVTINPNPSMPMVTAAAPSTCQGNSVAISTTTLSNVTYQWEMNGNDINGSTGTSIQASASGAYDVMVTDTNGCMATSLAVNFTVNPLPATPSITLVNGMLSSSTGASYQWYLNGNIIANATSQTYSYSQNGAYTVKITDANGCSATSNPYNVLNTSIAENSNTPAVTVAPNPYNTNTNISVVLPQSTQLTVEVYNAVGQKVTTLYNGYAAQGEQHFTFSAKELGYNNGLYLLKLIAPSFTQTIRLVETN